MTDMTPQKLDTFLENIDLVSISDDEFSEYFNVYLKHWKVIKSINNYRNASPEKPQKRTRKLNFFRKK